MKVSELVLGYRIYAGLRNSKKPLLVCEIGFILNDKRPWLNWGKNRGHISKLLKIMRSKKLIAKVGSRWAATRNIQSFRRFVDMVEIA
jgi:hypothetical protein